MLPKAVNLTDWADDYEEHFKVVAEKKTTGDTNLWVITWNETVVNIQFEFETSDINKCADIATA